MTCSSGRAGRAAPWFLTAALCAALAGPALAQGRARVSGTAVDTDGKPVPNLKVRFAPQENSATGAVEFTLNKQGQFKAGFFPVGRFKPEVLDEGWIVLRVDSLDRAVGKPVEAATFDVQDGHTIEVRIIVGKGSAEGPEGGGAPKPGEAPPALAKAIDLYQKGDMQGVLSETATLLEKDPKLGAAHFMRGVALSKTGDLAGSIASLRQALAFAPDQPGINGLLGSVLLQAGDKAKEQKKDDEAAADYREAVAQLKEEAKKTNNSPKVLNNLVIALERAGQTDEAAATLRQMVAADPDDDRPRLKLAQMLIDAGHGEEALAELDQLKSPTPAIVPDIYNALTFFYNKKDYAAVADRAAKWVQRMPDQGYLHRILGQALLGQGKYEDAIRELNEFIRLSPDSPDVAVDQKIVADLEKTLKKKK